MDINILSHDLRNLFRTIQRYFPTLDYDLFIKLITENYEYLSDIQKRVFCLRESYALSSLTNSLSTLEECSQGTPSEILTYEQIGEVLGKSRNCVHRHCMYAYHVLECRILRSLYNKWLCDKSSMEPARSVHWVPILNLVDNKRVYNALQNIKLNQALRVGNILSYSYEVLCSVQGLGTNGISYLITLFNDVLGDTWINTALYKSYYKNTK